MVGAFKALFRCLAPIKGNRERSCTPDGGDIKPFLPAAVKEHENDCIVGRPSIVIKKEL